MRYFICFLILVSFYHCKKDLEDNPFQFGLVDIKKSPIEVYTNTGIVTNSHHSVDNIIGNDWFNKNTINKIYFNSPKLASLKFNESDMKIALDYYHSDMSVLYLEDTIIFNTIKMGLNNQYDTISVRGVNYNDSIKLFGVFFALNIAVPQGVEYGYFDKDKMLLLSNGKNDTLALFHFTLTFKKR